MHRATNSTGSWNDELRRATEFPPEMQHVAFHPLADIFPLIEGTEFSELVADIRANGLREPIVLHDGQILDGRNRYRACLAAGIDPLPSARTFDGADPVAFVISLNLRRRHLDESQRSMVAARLAIMPLGGAVYRSANLQTDTPDVSQNDAADRLNVSPRSVASAKKVIGHGIPELAREVDSGSLSVSYAAKVADLPEEAQRAIVASIAQSRPEVIDDQAKVHWNRRAEARRAANDALRALAKPAMPKSKYSTIVIDPPWPVDKFHRVLRANQTALEYPTMTEDEIAAFPLADMAADNCHLFVWTTARFLPFTLQLVETWAFRYVCPMVWHKPGGFQPLNQPQYNCEFVIYAKRGSPGFVETKAFPCCFEAPRREHSRKPGEFYETIRRVTAEPRIDVFSREPRDGFAQFGNETQKFAAD